MKRRRTLTFGRLVLTTTQQAAGAPWLDGASVIGADSGTVAKSWSWVASWTALGLAVTWPGGRKPKPAAVLAWKGLTTMPNPHRWFRRRGPTGAPAGTTYAEERLPA